MTQQRIANLIAVVGTGAYTGVMIAIGLGLGRYWLSLDPADFEAWFTPNFWYLLPTVLSTLPWALIGTVWSLSIAWRTPARRAWLTVLALIGVTLVVTAGYHLPANIRIWSGELTAAQLESELGWWLVAHVARVGFALAGAVAGFLASTAGQGTDTP
ncbi:MAG: hypothetical protein AAF602_09530 [Myxococcota bacterium]